MLIREDKDGLRWAQMPGKLSLSERMSNAALSLRMWLIVKIAGRHQVGVNLTTRGFVMRPEGQLVLRNCSIEFEGSKVKPREEE